MAEKMLGFHRGTKCHQILEQQRFIEEFEKLSLEQYQTDLDESLPPARVFDPFRTEPCPQLNNNCEMGLQKEGEQLSTQSHQKLFTMLQSFKYQDEQIRIQNFHDLLYQFSISSNIVGIFVDFLQLFTAHSSSFQAEIGYLIKFAADRSNIYAVKFLSNVVHRVIEEIPEYSINAQNNVGLAEILIDSLRKTHGSENCYPIIKAIFTTMMANSSAIPQILQVGGESLLDQLFKNYDYSTEYMLSKLIKQGNLTKSCLQQIATEIVNNFNRTQSTIPKIFITKQLYQQSFYRILQSIYTVEKNLLIEKFAGFFIDNGIDVELEYLPKMNFSTSNEYCSTKSLIEQFKKIRVSQHRHTEQMMDQQVKAFDVQPHKKTKKDVQSNCRK